MKSPIFLRNSIESFLYRRVARPLFFLVKPEAIHNHMLGVGKVLGSNPLGRSITKLFFNYKDESLQQKILGITFPNPVGLAAGFDKNGVLTTLLDNVGFGFMEIGSVTGQQCDGNSGTRLWRLKEKSSLIVNYGLANDGAEEIANRLSKSTTKIPLGISIAATNSQETAEELGAIRDYAKAYAIFARLRLGDYYTINISCPNSFGGESFLAPARLEHLLTVIDGVKNLYKAPQPIFLKLAAAIDDTQLDDIIAIARKHHIKGFVCSNLFKDSKQSGGLSGKPVKEISTALIRSLYKKTKGEFIIIGCGGIFGASDAYEKIKAGANLLQLITGMIYQGPQLISEINSGLVQLLKQDGYTNIAQAVGAEGVVGAETEAL